MRRKIEFIEKGSPAVDGAGVNLVRVLGHHTIKKYNPFLMLDSFDSKEPKDYIKGFPMHPHRGIETITYLSEGGMKHKDSLGNVGIISGGGVQWMTTGSGILHEEMPIASENMLGIQLWLNLPKKNKMTEAKYYDIPKEKIPVLKIDGGSIRIVSGEYQGIKGHKANFLPMQFYAIKLDSKKEYTIKTNEDDFAFLFLLKGDAKVEKRHITEKSAVALSKGKEVSIEAENQDIEILYISAPKLDEPIAWAGPIVMNTQAELEQAFMELNNGNFLKRI